MKHICFIIAMKAEAKPLIQHFNLLEMAGCFGQLPIKAYRSTYKNNTITLILNGKDSNTGLDYIGCEAATLTTHLAISRFSPDIIINAGTAGGFISKGAAIGDIYLSHKYIVFHDRRVAIPGWEEMGTGYFPTINTDLLAQRSGYKQGVCTTGSSLDLIPADLVEMEKTGGSVKDMEAAAIAWVASLYQTPMFCVKAITDLVDSGHPTPFEFQKNIKLATENLRDACFKIIDEGWLKQP